MSITNCPTCDESIDTDFDIEHFKRCADEDREHMESDDIKEMEDSHDNNCAGFERGLTADRSWQ